MIILCSGTRLQRVLRVNGRRAAVVIASCFSSTVSGVLGLHSRFVSEVLVRGTTELYVLSLLASWYCGLFLGDAHSPCSATVTPRKQKISPRNSVNLGRSIDLQVFKGSYAQLDSAFVLKW